MKYFLWLILSGDDDAGGSLSAPPPAQGQAGVARRGFDERAAGFELALALGRLDQVQADAILDGAAGILILELEEQLTRPVSR